MSISSLPPPIPFRSRRKRDQVKRLKVDQPEDLLALLPYLLGFQPEESLVMMVIANREVRVTMRVDLVDDVAGVGERFAAVATAQHADGVVLVALSSDPERADAMLLPVLESLSPLRVIEAIYTNGSRWWSRICSDSCCPPEGTPYETGSNRLVAEAVFHGMTSYPDRSGIERLAEGPPTVDLPALEELAADLAPELLDDRRRSRRWRRTRMRRLVSAYLDRRRRGDQVELDDRDLTTLALLAVDKLARDQAWALMEREYAWIHVELWQRVVSRSVAKLAPPVLCLLGIAAWIGGQGTLQVCCLERARKLDPNYTMADILEDLNVRAVPPSAWDRMKTSMREALDDAYDNSS